MPYVFLVITLVAMVAGQLLLRKGMLEVGQFPGFDHLWSFFVKTFTQPYVLMAIFCVLIAALSWMVTLSKTELSRVYPFMGLSFVLVALGSWVFFGESLNLWRWVGIAFITAGVFLVLGVK
jgi:uncharacterized membrane protein